jgi:hypothetical protein
MARVRNSCQHSQTAGTAVTTGNSALPDAFTLITPGTGGAITWELDATAPGTKSIRHTPAAATQCYSGYGSVPDSANSWTFRKLWQAPNPLPGTFQPILTFRSIGGGAAVGSVAIDSAGRFQVIADTAGTSNVSASAMTAGAWYDLSVRGENGTISTGVMALKVRAPVSGTEDTNLSVTHGTAIGAGTANFGTTAVGTYRGGKVGTTGNMAATEDKFIDFQTGTSAELPQPGLNDPPVVPPITRKIQVPSTPTSFTAAPTDDGTIVSRTWTIFHLPDGTAVTSGVTGATTDTVTIPAQTTKGAYDVNYSATDDGSLTTSTETRLFVQMGNGEAARPYETLANPGNWGGGGSAADALAGVRSTTSGSYSLTTDAPVADSVTYAMEVPAAGHYDVAMTIAWMGTDGTTLVAGTTGPITAQVFQGTTAITSEKVFTQPLAAWLPVSFSFDTLEDSALTADLKDIRIVIKASQV